MTSTTERARVLRRTAIIVVIVALSLTALAGIIAILIGSFDETVARILGSTLAVGVAGVAVLCNLTLLTRPLRHVGTAGSIIAVATLIVALVLVWVPYASLPARDEIGQVFGVLLVFTVSFAQASLVLLLAERRHRFLRIGLLVLLSLIAVAAFMIAALIASTGDITSDAYWRVLATVLILDALGTIVVPVVSVFLADPGAEPRAYVTPGAAREGERYSHGHHESVLKSHTWRTVENSAAYLIPHLEAGLRVLDVGCGPGTITVDLARRVAPGTVVGVDASPEVIEKAAAHAAAEGVDNVDFRVGDAYALDFDDDSFDIVHIHQTLQHVADPVAVLRELRRVVRPGGVVAARDVDYAGTMVEPETAGLARWASLYQQVHRSNGGEPDAGRRLKAWARAAGFSDVEATASIWCFASDPDREWWGSMWEARVLQSAFAGDATEKGFATRAELEEISAAWRVWADDADAWMGMPHGEIIARG